MREWVGGCNVSAAGGEGIDFGGRGAADTLCHPAILGMDDSGQDLRGHGANPTHGPPGVDEQSLRSTVAGTPPSRPSAPSQAPRALKSPPKKMLSSGERFLGGGALAGPPLSSI